MKKEIKQIIPSLLLDFFSKIRYNKKKSNHQNKRIDEVFNDIYTQNLWGNEESVSGVGSTIAQTKKIIPELEKCFDNLKIKTLLDIPCGDFNWMQHLHLNNIEYTGADIVKEMIEKNQSKFADIDKQFLVKNMLTDDLPKSNLILIRDCWVHFSYDDIFKALNNIVKSASNYVMITTFPKHSINYDIVTGDWRPLNLKKAPFFFPEPIMTIEEHYDPKYKKEAKNKSLCVWKIEDLKKLTCIHQK